MSDLLCYIDGVPARYVWRSTYNDGRYTVKFGHDVTLANLEAINWKNPAVVVPEPKSQHKTYLPVGVGFKLEELTYSSHPKEWTAEICITDRYLGDVTGYQAEIDTLETESAAKDAQIAELQEDSAAKDAQIEALQEDGTAAAETELQEDYREGVESIG